MRYSDDKKLGDINLIMIKSYQIESKMTEISIQKIWPELMGKTISNYTQRIVFQKGILMIHIESSSLKNELNLGKDKIQNLINEKLGSEKVKSVKIL
ncbi:MAG: hypothetical protein RJA52_1124 [Bacteroidota bacterium]|jgi:predicted nucleic acid-binding Zn ribbon protein